jgi:hypothetical protein
VLVRKWQGSGHATRARTLSLSVLFFSFFFYFILFYFILFSFLFFSFLCLSHSSQTPCAVARPELLHGLPWAPTRSVSQPHRLSLAPTREDELLVVAHGLQSIMEQTCSPRGLNADSRDWPESAARARELVVRSQSLTLVGRTVGDVTWW